MDLHAVTSSYKRWAPIYDHTFGQITHAGRNKAVDAINKRTGSVLEVGVGTGLSLSRYAPHLKVTGIDFSQEMLDKAHEKVTRDNLTNVVELRQMDARELDFPDGHFDTVVAMYLVSVVPEPERVMAEIARVCKPGGQVIIVNHFAKETGFMARIERAFAPFANHLGWHSDFPRDKVLGQKALDVHEEHRLAPLGLFTFLRLQKAA